MFHILLYRLHQENPNLVSYLSNASTDPIKEEEEESDDPNYLYYRPQARAAPQGGAFSRW